MNKERTYTEYFSGRKLYGDDFDNVKQIAVGIK